MYPHTDVPICALRAGDLVNVLCLVLSGSTTLVLVDHIEVWASSHDNPVALDDVEAWLRDTAGRCNRADIVMDSWQGAATGQRLRTDRLDVTDIALSAQVNDCLAAHYAAPARGHCFAPPHDDDLFDEFVNVRIVERTPGQYRIDHATDLTTTAPSRSPSPPNTSSTSRPAARPSSSCDRDKP